MDSNFLLIESHRELVDFLDRHFSDRDKTPVFILSKPFSGRTSTINSVAQACGISSDELEITHLYHDSFGRMLEENKRPVSFDDWAKECIQKDNDKYLFVEVDPDWMYVVPDGRKMLLSSCYQTRLFKGVFYVPTVQDWIEWAVDNDICPELVDFAKAYPVFYSVDHSIYPRLEERLRVIEERLKDSSDPQKNTQEWVGHNIMYLTTLGYAFFMHRLSEPLCDLFINYLKNTRFADAFKVTR